LKTLTRQLAITSGALYINVEAINISKLSDSSRSSNPMHA